MNDNKNDKDVPLEDMYKKNDVYINPLQIPTFPNGKKLGMYISSILFTIHLNMKLYCPQVP